LSEAIYLYCLAHSGHPPAIEGTGVDGGHPLFPHRFATVTAVLSTIRLEEFCGPEAESNLRDLEWVGPRACRHEAVVEKVMAHSPVFPIPFGTIFSSLKSLEEFLLLHHDAIARFLDQLAGCEEWAIKGLIDTAKAAKIFLATALEQALPDHESYPPGKRYLAEKRLRSRAEQDVRDWLKKVGREIADDLCRHAADFRPLPVLSREATGTAADMVLNWALLIPQGCTGEVQARIDRANADCHSMGLHFHLSGPWPPYSFRPSLAPGQNP
jgi:hypothetical protein